MGSNRWSVGRWQKKEMELQHTQAQLQHQRAVLAKEVQDLKETLEVSNSAWGRGEETSVRLLPAGVELKLKTGLERVSVHALKFSLLLFYLLPSIPPFFPLLPPFLHSILLFFLPPSLPFSILSSFYPFLSFLLPSVQFADQESQVAHLELGQIECQLRATLEVLRERSLQCETLRDTVQSLK